MGCHVPHQVTIIFANLNRYHGTAVPRYMNMYTHHIRKLFHHIVMLSDEHALGAMLGAYVRILSGVR
jgi:hypothetical protein